MKKFFKRILDRYWMVIDDTNAISFHERSEKPFKLENPDFEDDRINKSFHIDNNKWTHDEFVKKLSGTYIIEPDYAYCIKGLRKIVRSSIFYEDLKPSVLKFLKNYKTTDILSEAIIFDGETGNNYFHFFTDILPKLWLLDKVPHYQNVPLIIGKETYSAPYFQYLYNTTSIKNYNWLFQKPKQYLKITNAVYLIKPMPFEYDYFLKSKSLLQLPQRTFTNKKLFLNRNIKTGRYIENFHEIEPILRKNQFEIIETESLTVHQQAELFNSAKYLISIHGAGNTNIIFSEKDLHFLEICPENRIACQFYWLAKTLNIEYYDIILGQKLPYTNVYPEKGFYLDPVKLENAIIKMQHN